ncbi:MAG: carbon-nitrogen hydrolase family protein [Kiritimatiellia bacterium]
MKRVTLLLGLAALPLAAADWTFREAPLTPDRCSARRLATGGLELRVPSKRAVGWWEAKFPVRGPAVRVTARAEIALDDAKDPALNDVAMLVTFYDPKIGDAPGRRFVQRDFIACTDRVADGTVERTFDATLPVPGGSREMRVEFIAKWHPMTIVFGEPHIENLPLPPPRRVRCVVGNPHEGPVDWSNPERAVARRLGQIEATLTNIFAHVEHPDLILFSECFTDTGSPVPEKTFEPIPGGPTWRLAARYAARHKCNIAMNVHELTPEGEAYNTVFIVDRDGKLAGTYRKTHLTSGEYQKGILPGDDYKAIRLDFGTVGCLVCWDNWFSESAKFARRKGAELLLFPLAGCAADHMDYTWPSRTIDAGIPMLVATRQGHLPSGILDRDGTWLAQTRADNGFAWADVDLDERKRTLWLSVGPGLGDPYQLYLDESRPELYLRQAYPPRR